MHICPACGKQFVCFACRIKNAKNVCCSKLCSTKLQQKQIAKKCVVCGDTFTVSPGYAKRYSTCNKPECRIAKKCKERNPNWRGGVSKKRSGVLKWRNAVYKRDGYKCVQCGSTTNLTGDHIKPWAFFPELRHDVANGRTLCYSCHKKTYKSAYEWRSLLVSEGKLVRVPYKRAPITCVMCGHKFQPNSNTKLCSQACRAKRSLERRRAWLLAHPGYGTLGYKPPALLIEEASPVRPAGTAEPCVPPLPASA
jgi:hypothetical protein